MPSHLIHNSSSQATLKSLYSTHHLAESEVTMTHASPSEANTPTAATDGSGWPAGYWKGVYGCLDDLSVDDSGLNPSLDDSCDWFAQVADAE